MPEPLADLVPGQHPVADGVSTVVFAALSAVPVVGGPVVEIASGVLASRQTARQYEFNTAVATALQRVVEEVDGLTPVAIVESDEFMAAYERASRAAAETASAQKRTRLATALRHAGPWSSLREMRRAQLLEFVMRFDDLHFAMLQFFADPRAWLRANVPDWEGPRGWGTSTIGALLGEYYFPDMPGWLEAVSPVLSELKDAGLLDNAPLSIGMTPEGTVQERTKPLGDELLAFVQDESAL